MPHGSGIAGLRSRNAIKLSRVRSVPEAEEAISEVADAVNHLIRQNEHMAEILALMHSEMADTRKTLEQLRLIAYVVAAAVLTAKLGLDGLLNLL